jgi:hypothetical protein
MTTKLRRPYRVGVQHWFLRALLTLATLYTAVLVPYLLWGPWSDRPDGAPAPSLADRAWALVAIGGSMVLLILLVWKLATSGAFVDRSGVVVRSLRRRRYSWEEVTGFDTGGLTSGEVSSVKRKLAVISPKARRLECLRIHLRDGRVVVVDVVSSTVTWLGTKPSEIAKRLEACRPA